MKKIFSIFIILIILCFSVVNCYSVVSNQYSIDDILKNGAWGYNTDSFYDNSFNLLTYLNYLNTEEGHACSTFNSGYCSILEYYRSFVSSYSEVGSSYYYYVLYTSSNSFFDFYYILSDNELYYQLDGTSHLLKINSGDIRYFQFNGMFDGNKINLWRGSKYLEPTDSFVIPGNVNNILLSNADVLDKNGDVVFDKNIIVEDPEPDVPVGSDITMDGISSVIKNAFSSLTETITSFFDTLLAPLEFIKEHLLKLNPVSALLGVMEYITEFFAFAGDGMLIFAEFYSSMPFLVQCFFWSPFIILIVVGTVIKMLG